MSGTSIVDTVALRDPYRKAYTMEGLGFRDYSGTGTRLVTLLDTLTPQQD